MRTACSMQCISLNPIAVVCGMLQVRGLGIDNRGFLTASRDKLVKLWTERDAHSFDNSLTLVRRRARLHAAFPVSTHL